MSISYKDERIASLLFAFIGIGYLFPFSALTQPVDYWSLLFPNFDIEFPITAIYMWVNLVVLGLLVFVYVEIPNPKMYSIRIYGGFIGQFIALFIVPTSYFLQLNEYYNVIIVLSCTAFAAGVTAYIDSCAISLSSQYPTSCQEGLQLGIGVSTLIGSTYRILSKILFPPGETVAASLCYFYCGAATVLACCWGYYVLVNLDISKKCLYNNNSDIEMSSSSSSSSSNSSSSYKGGTINSGETSPLLHSKSSSTTTTTTTTTPTTEYYLKVFKNAIFNELVVFICFSSTLSVWPAMISAIPSYNYPHLNHSHWYELILLFIFALLDVIGRFLVPYRLGLTKDNIHVPVLLRCLLLPLILLLANGYIKSDILAVSLVAVLGYTNGYLGSLSIVLVNEVVEPQDRSVVGTLTGFTLNAGLVVGATIAVIIQPFVLKE